MTIINKETSDLPASNVPLRGDEILHIVQSLNSRQVTVADLSGNAYGAVADGTTDDRAALLSGSDAGKELILPSGSYKINSDLTIATKVTFQQGAKLKPASGVTVTLAGGYYADEAQHVFDISLGGRCFATKLSPSTQYHWGAVSDVGDGGSGSFSGTDNRAAFQACIDNHVYWHGASQAYFAPGGFRIDGTLICNYGDSFRKLVITGPEHSGSFIGGAETNSCNLGFNTWENAFEIQGARGTTIANLNITGRWYGHISTNNLGSTAASLTVSNWVPSGAPGDVQNRYKYSCGIHVDPRSGAKPGTYYSDVTYPTGYPGANYGGGGGLGAQYNKNYSSQVQVVDCHVRGFGCGIATQGCDADGNGDYTHVINGSIDKCFICMAWGNTQARLVRVNGTNFSNYYTAYDTKTIGRQLGKPHVHASHQELGYGVRLGNVSNMSYGACFTFDHCYAEVLYHLGEFSASALNTGGVIFTGCEFQFIQTARVIPKYMLKIVEGGLTVIRSTFGGEMQSPFIIEGKPTNVEFSGLIQTNAGLDWLGNPTTRAKAIAHGSTNGLMFVSGNGDQGPWTGSGNRTRYSLSTGTPTIDYYGYGNIARSDVTKVIAFSSSLVTSTSAPSADATPCFVGNSYIIANEGSLSSITHISGVLTINTTASYSLPLRVNYGMAAGGILHHQNTGTLFVITSSTNNQIVADQLNNYEQGTYVHTEQIIHSGCGQFFGTPTGHYLPLQDCEITYTSGSSGVTFATAAGSNTFQDQFPVGAVRVGIADNTALIPVVENNAEIMASSAGSITLNGNARLTTTTKAGLWFVPR